jgi:tripartite ATP-independent transporter DctM subunit
MMNSSGVTHRLFDFAIALVGRFRGGLAYANVLASMFFASMSGTAVGDAGGLGQVEMQMMTKAGYRKAFTAGISATSSILGPLIPPSVAFVILGAVAEISIGKLFLAGFLPGLLMVLALFVQIFLKASFTREGKDWPVTKTPLIEIPRTFTRAFLPLMMPVIIVGGISSGILTPTEAAIIAIDYAIILGLIYKELTFKIFIDTLKQTVITSGTFIYIVAVAGFFTWILTREGLPQILQTVLEPLYSIGPYMAILAIVLVSFIVGMFIDTASSILLIVPIIMPISNTLGLDPVYMGVVITIALLIGIVTPPFGICLFVLSNVAEIPVSEVTREALKYIPAMLVTLLLVIIFPQLSLYLPNLIFK